MKSDITLLVQVLISLLLFDLRIYCQEELEVGDSCTTSVTEEPGTCKIHSDCPEATELAQRGVDVKLCGFYQLTTPVVCCKNAIRPPAPNDLLTDDNISFPQDVPNLQGNSVFSGAAKKSEQKCLEYSKAVMDVVHAIPLVTNVEPISIDVTNCEYNSVALIVGGTPASAGEFPFMASIGFEDTDDGGPIWRCGGTLISDRWVLTAGHCTFTKDAGEPKWIRLGALDLDKNQEEGRVDYLIRQIVVHPGYQSPQKYNDIALLQTDNRVQFSKFVRPACLYTKPSFTQNVAIATGWGTIAYAGPSSTKLLKVLLNIYNNDVCAKVYQRDTSSLPQGIKNTMLCVGEVKGGKDTCQGDSGGPVFITEKENMCKFYVVGVTSFGKICGQNLPAVYTRVSEYVEWIERTIW